MLKLLVACVLVLITFAVTFRIEGYSQFLGRGETVHFLTLGRCEREATSTYPDGGRRYSGYVCKRTFLGLTLDTVEFYDGKRVSQVD
jgi:hypothetical protein